MLTAICDLHRSIPEDCDKFGNPLALNVTPLNLDDEKDRVVQAMLSLSRLFDGQRVRISSHK